MANMWLSFMFLDPFRGRKGRRPVIAALSGSQTKAPGFAGGYLLVLKNETRNPVYCIFVNFIRVKIYVN